MPTTTKTPRTDRMVNKPYFSPSEWIESHKTLELENQSLTRRLEEVTKERDDAKFSRDHWRTSYEDEHRANQLLIHTTTESDAKLTALRTAAVGAISGFAQALRQWKAYHDGTFEQAVDDADLEDANHLEGEFYQSATSALAALRAELDQADSNASNSPTASRESQG